MASFSRILAVDLGASAVRLAEIGLDPKGRPVLLDLAEEEVIYDPAKTSDFFPVYAPALAAATARLRSKTRTCHLCLGGPAVFSRILKVPASEPTKVSSMLRFEAQQTVPAIEQALWDHQLLPSTQPVEVEALILAIKKETVEEMMAAAAAAGLKPQAATLAPAALLNSFLYNYPEVEGCALLLEIGTRAATILLVEGGRLFVRVVPLGGAAVTQAAAADLQESFAGAEILKKAKGFVHPGGAYEDPPDPSTARISKLARGVMTRLYGEVERSITFFRSQQGGRKPDRVWLAGGGALLGYTDLFFREKLKIPVEFFQSFRRLTLPGGPVATAAARNFPAWAVAVGTGVQALPDAPVRINVLGSAERAQAQRGKDRPAVLAAMAAAPILLALPALHSFWQAEKAGTKLAEENQRVAEADQALARLQLEQKKFLTVVEQLELATRLEQERLRWPGLLEELRKHSPPRLWITGLRLVSDEADKKGPGVSPSSPGSAPLVEIRGMFETQSEKADAEGVEQFARALEAGGVLQKVKILEREVPEYIDGKTDQVALKFRLRAEWPTGQPKTKKAAEGSS